MAELPAKRCSFEMLFILPDLYSYIEVCWTSERLFEISHVFFRKLAQGVTRETILRGPQQPFDEIAP